MKRCSSALSLPPSQALLFKLSIYLSAHKAFQVTIKPSILHETTASTCLLLPRPCLSQWLPKWSHLLQQALSHQSWPRQAPPGLSWSSCWSSMAIPSRTIECTGYARAPTLIMVLWFMWLVMWDMALNLRSSIAIISMPLRTLSWNGSCCNGSTGSTLMRWQCSIMGRTRPTTRLSVDLRPVCTKSRLLRRVWILWMIKQVSSYIFWSIRTNLKSFRARQWERRPIKRTVKHGSSSLPISLSRIKYSAMTLLGSFTQFSSDGCSSNTAQHDGGMDGDKRQSPSFKHWMFAIIMCLEFPSPFKSIFLSAN